MCVVINIIYMLNNTEYYILSKFLDKLSYNCDILLNIFDWLF